MQEAKTGHLHKITEDQWREEKSKPAEVRMPVFKIGEPVMCNGGLFKVRHIKRRRLVLEGISEEEFSKLELTDRIDRLEVAEREKERDRE